MKRTICLAFVAGVVGLPAPALAVEFSDIDANADGAITKDEFFAAYSGADESGWIAVDVNGDGQISCNEHEVAAQSGALPVE